MFAPIEGEMQFFHANDGCRLAYRQHGDISNPPLILLHGFTGSSAVWQKNLPALSKQYNCVAPDLRGHGQSTKTIHGFHVSRLAMDLHELLLHLRLDDMLQQQPDGTSTQQTSSERAPMSSAGIRCIAGSLGCAILWSYAELFTPRLFSHQVWVDQAPMQNYALGDGVPQGRFGPWGSEKGNFGMNCEGAVRVLKQDLSRDPEGVYLGTARACLGYVVKAEREGLEERIQGEGKDAMGEALYAAYEQRRAADEAFFVGIARQGYPEWYGELMADHTARDWRPVIASCFSSIATSSRDDGVEDPGKADQLRDGARRVPRILVVASPLSGCFPVEGCTAAADLANGVLTAGGSRDGVRADGRRDIARAVVVEWGGHWCYWEEPGRFNELVMEFLGES